MTVRTRFAPSPTGELHLGSIRTALYSWLFARKNNGEFILRIEDTDEERIKKISINNIIETMKLLGLNWDHGPYFQTKKLEKYNIIAKEMIYSGIAYKCYCSKNRINNLRIMQINKGEKPKYDGFCRNIEEKNIKNKRFVVRFSNPKNGYVIFNDLIRGTLKFKNSELDDLIILRSNKIPTYNFCSVIDDHDMNISHVIRGEDHINNTPRQINIFKALKIKCPKYAHISMILDKDRKKLSKKNQSTDVMKYIKNGFLPEALLNYLVRLGWSYGNQEIFNIDEMKKLFNLKSVGKSSCIFDINKLLWINQYYIQKLSDYDISSQIKKFFNKKEIDFNQGPKIENLIKIFKKKSRTLKEIFNQILFFYEDFSKVNFDLIKKYFTIDTNVHLKIFCKKLEKTSLWSVEEIKNTFFCTIKELNFNIKKIAMPIRIILSGSEHSPSIYSIIYSCGKLQTIKKIKIAIKFINDNKKKLNL
ncbi:gltX [Wigglesworthia glossinidia endosymbiont of Glossina brevipalpis]|uniref:Glutamate--tRNA ligase n=1 Tax=Wigglesworthia glossinidia brevipalpis TaxID=36870 RepID=SYE_WIGBR|nr:RecName: Full=Glutamate--tRNA ligase; AltName: Full=Glutamyl-tRNA synthetase; Short=GluRS [Wigglesworthia glossinidia endosymbiont of Glossina brevipalpis]BAC24272.1 gltX [Wigglesworthia glossinidia endosymbiont of Glossina brevipalpis]